MIRTEFAARPASVRSAKKRRTRAGVRDRNRTVPRLEPTLLASTSVSKSTGAVAIQGPAGARSPAH